MSFAAHKIVLALSILVAGPVAAEVTESAADGFLVTIAATTSATPAKVYAALVQPQSWWSDEHTWSGKAANLSLKPEAGGCFCERWSEGSAEHGRVIMALPEKLLRLDGALGPLQEFSLKGTLSFWLKPGEKGGTELSVEYRVNGAGSSGLDTFAPRVDDVIGTQVGRLVRYIDSGHPDVPAKPAKPAIKEESQLQREAREAILEDWKKSAEGQQPTAEKVPTTPLAPPAKKTKPAKADATKTDGSQNP